MQRADASSFWGLPLIWFGCGRMPTTFRTFFCFNSHIPFIYFSHAVLKCLEIFSLVVFVIGNTYLYKICIL